MSGIRGVLFDKDGTLFDFQKSWSGFAQTLLTELSGDDPERARRLARVLGFDPQAGRFASDSIVIAETTLTVARHLVPHLPDWPDTGRLAAQLDQIAAATPQVAAAPLVPLFARLRAAGLALGVVTNDSEASARRHLAAHGLQDAVDFIAGYDSGHGAKPDPGPALAFTAAVRLEPAVVALVGDSAHDMSAARAAGMVPVAVLTGPATAQALAPLAAVVLPSVADLPDWLGL